MPATAYDEYQRGLHEGFNDGVTAERERCAKIAESEPEAPGDMPPGDELGAA